MQLVFCEGSKRICREVCNFKERRSWGRPLLGLYYSSFPYWGSSGARELLFVYVGGSPWCLLSCLHLPARPTTLQVPWAQGHHLFCSLLDLSSRDLLNTYWMNEGFVYASWCARQWSPGCSKVRGQRSATISHHIQICTWSINTSVPRNWKWRPVTHGQPSPLGRLVTRTTHWRKRGGVGVGSSCSGMWTKQE